MCGGRKFTYVLRYKNEGGKRRWETLGHADRRKAEKQRAKKKINIYAEAQCRRILKAAQEYDGKWDPKKSVKWDLIITVALATAMRRAELLNCTWADVDLDAQTIEVNSKQSTKETWDWLIKDADHRTLPLTEEIVQMLVDHHARQLDAF